MQLGGFEKIRSMHQIDHGHAFGTRLHIYRLVGQASFCPPYPAPLERRPLTYTNRTDLVHELDTKSMDDDSMDVDPIDADRGHLGEDDYGAMAFRTGLDDDYDVDLGTDREEDIRSTVNAALGGGIALPPSQAPLHLTATSHSLPDPDPPVGEECWPSWPSAAYIQAEADSQHGELAARRATRGRPAETDRLIAQGIFEDVLRDRKNLRRGSPPAQDLIRRIRSRLQGYAKSLTEVAKRKDPWTQQAHHDAHDQLQKLIQELGEKADDDDDIYDTGMLHSRSIDFLSNMLFSKDIGSSGA